jgi:hypothetical protein
MIATENDEPKLFTIEIDEALLVISCLQQKMLKQSYLQ